MKFVKDPVTRTDMLLRKGGPGDGGWPHLLVSLMVCCNLFLVLVTFHHNSKVKSNREAIDANLNATAHLERNLLQKFDNLAFQIRSTISSSAKPASEASPELPLNTVVRVNHRGARKLCSYSEQELRGILSLRHGCGWGNPRYFYDGTWLPWKLLHAEFEKTKEGVVKGQPECVLACKKLAELHCSPGSPCVHAFYLRRRSSDTLVLRQLYEWGEHVFLKPDFPFSYILDAGANVGIASVLFATMFPNATIVSVEASSNNFRSLKLNAAPFPNIVPINAAIWPRVAPLSLVRGPRNLDMPPEWGFMVKETNKLEAGQAVEDSLVGVSVTFLLKVFGFPAFDFVKVDIEGGEGELISSSADVDTTWVDKAKLISLELHGDMAPGSNVSVLNFFSAKPEFTKITDTRLVEEFVMFKRTDAFVSQ